jgi:hypothetical protein
MLIFEALGQGYFWGGMLVGFIAGMLLMSYLHVMGFTDN